MDQRQQLHNLVDHMTPTQIDAAVGFFERFLDPVSVALARAPIDDEPAGTFIPPSPPEECTSLEDFIAELQTEDKVVASKQDLAAVSRR